MTGSVRKKVDPAKFIVRRHLYPQDAEYPDACARITEKALEQDFESINDLMQFIEDQKSELPLPDDTLGDSYWRKRYKPRDEFPGCSMLYTDITARYGDTFRRELDAENATPTYEQRYGKSISEKVTWRGEDGDVEREVPWSSYSMVRRPPEVEDTHYTGEIMHPPIYDIDDERDVDGPVYYANESAVERMEREKMQGFVQFMSDERDSNEFLYRQEERWSLIAQAFVQARKSEPGSTEGRDAALTCYARLSHDAGHDRGSATMARIVLEYLSHKLDFEVPFTKLEYDLNTEAIRRTPQQFIRDWDADEYFDRDVTSESVLDWQRQHIAARQAHRS